MSYHISIWSVSERIGRKEAMVISAEICANEDVVPRGLIASPNVDEFRLELEKTYPLEPSDSCPWACDFSQGPTHITLYCSYSRVPEVVQFVLPLAFRHGLSLFDERTQLIYLPPALVESSDCTLESPCLFLPISASAEMISDILDILPHRHDPYLIVARGDQYYMQTCWTEAGFILEYRDGSAKSHYRANLELESDAVVQIIQEYVRNGAWQSSTTFERIDL
ncbi:MAG: hypothetical protein R3B90_12540 [Planctomycetaceae bacterium]